VKLPLKASGMLAAVILLAACSSRGMSTAVPQLPAADGSSNSATMSTGNMFFDNVRVVCPNDSRPGFAHCDALARTDIAPNVSTVSGYGPTDLISAYNLPAASKNTVVAIVDAYGYPTAESDLGNYRTQFGLPACTTANGCFKKINQRGQQSNYPPTNSGWDQEQALDVDMVSAACATCHILLVQGDDNSFKNLGTAVNQAVKQGAHVVSNSYSGECTGKMPRVCGAQWYNHAHVIILASGGDGGYWGSGINVVPAGLPSVVGVGGTSLRRSSGGRGWTETAWRGTGSGCTSFPKPTWQKDTGCTGRVADDASAVADPNTGVAVNYNNQWLVFGGTSVSSPFLGGIYGLAGNAASLVRAKSLYTNAANLYDITSGADGSCSPSYICVAGPGYDGPTGNGTPNGIGAF
jgi:subtilase family serine protease